MTVYPSYDIKMNTEDSHQTNPGWIVLFIRFKEPASMYTSGINSNQQNQDQLNSRLMDTESVTSSIIENDCVGIDTDNSKGSFGKTCTISLEITDTVWQNAVSTGDWAFVWMSDNKSDMDNLANFLRTHTPAQYGNQLCSWDSGLKHVGRVINTSFVDNTAPGGTKTVRQSISCQSFLELATSVYYTYYGLSSVNPASGTPSGTTTAEAQTYAETNRLSLANSRLDRALQGIASTFLQVYKNKLRTLTPDDMIGIMFSLILGVPNPTKILDGSNSVENTIGSASDAIAIPPVVGAILGRPSARLLWELYNVYMGVQKYSPADPTKPWVSFMPKFEPFNTNDAFRVFWRSPGNDGRCKGISPFEPPAWTNETMWAILNQYLNPVVNEMYTALRVNSDNTIGPSLIIREMPFSTGLNKAVVNDGIVPIALKSIVDSASSAGQQSRISQAVQSQKQSNGTSTPDSGSVPTPISSAPIVSLVKDQLNSFTYYNTVPRWVIDPSMVRTLSVSCSESNRINFVQVWGRNGSTDFLGIQRPPELWRQAQIGNNAVIDRADVHRHGLRSDISESSWDFFTQNDTSGSWAPIWARMRADWLFNGHLKLQGTIVCNGIKAPICEGDNLQYQGIVYHIENVSHSIGVDGGGRKHFITTMALSRGVRDQNLGPDTLPMYYRSQGTSRENIDLPAATILQAIPGTPSKDEGND